VLHVGVWRLKAAVADWHNALQLKALYCQGAYRQLAKQQGATKSAHKTGSRCQLRQIMLAVQVFTASASQHT
jgi:hypothetical protein